MEENIFEGAKFGDKFLTRDGSIAVFIKLHTSNYNIDGEEYAEMCIEGVDVIIGYEVNGYIHSRKYKHEHDIISRYKEPIDENKLDELAWESLKILNGNRDTVSQDVASMMAGFKIGYRKAKEW